MLSKEKILFERDEKGTLIPKVVKLEGTDEEIKITPLVRGEFLRIFSETKDGQTNKDQDAEIIKNHLVEPKLDDDEIRNMKSGYATIIVATILKHSGLKVEKEKNLGELEDFTKGKTS